MKHLKPTRSALTAVAALMLAAGSGVLQSCDKDVLTGQPGWLGNSIYERLQDDGNYKYTLRLIDDLGQTAVLSQTGSKTLFAADDDAFETWFQTNSWGVKKYEDLTEAQKKLLLNSSMINNAYLIELLSNVSATSDQTTPEEGMCMRRESAISIFDSIARIYPDQMPNTRYWARYKDHKDGIVLLRDNTAKPMIHFLPAYMKQNNITDNDLAILTNGESNSVNDAWVNGKKVIDRDITCKNGYIHKVDGVMTSSDNMAGIIATHPNMSTFSHLLERFSAPYYDDAATKEYDRLHGTTDSVFVLRHFATTANTGNYGAAASGNLNNDPDGQAVDAQLLFDPSWNQYILNSNNTSGYDMHYDAGAMLVPSNQALNTWWNNDGRVLQEMYGSWDNVPLKVLVKLLNINMVSTFSETVPSKFANIVDNTTKVSLGVKTTDVDSCFMGCNGVVYLLNRVFTPADYSSVSFPALINSDGADGIMSVIYWAIDNLNFEPYLNSMDSRYSFIIPTNQAMLTYVDPCSYGTGRTKLYRFTYNNQRKTVVANRYDYDMTTGIVDEASKDSVTDANQINDRLEDLVNNLIVVGDIEDGHTYYKTKGGAPLIVKGRGVGSMTINGAFQQEQGGNNYVSHIYDQSTNGNGKAYVLNAGLPLTSQRSTYSILQDNDQFSEFFKLLSGSSLHSRTSLGNYAAQGEENISFFDNYNYTVYVPTNASIKQLIDQGYLPTWDDYESLTAADFGGDRTALRAAQTSLQNIITNFLRYHFQDNSVFIGGTPVSNVKYESSKINPANRRYYSLTVNADDNNLTVGDQLGHTRHVIKNNGLYDIIGREYWISNRDRVTTNQIYQASDVVVHQIDGPLFYDESQMKPWREVIGLTTSAKAHKNAKARRR